MKDKKGHCLFNYIKPAEYSTLCKRKLCLSLFLQSFKNIATKKGFKFRKLSKYEPLHLTSHHRVSFKLQHIGQHQQNTPCTQTNYGHIPKADNCKLNSIHQPVVVKLKQKHRALATKLTTSILSIAL